jgi:hypothetical protein
MAKAQEPRSVRSRSELQQALTEQIDLLTSYCKHYDKGESAYCKPMAATLRMLLHETRMSRSLLGQLHLRIGRFFTVAPALNPRNLLSECGLLILDATAGKWLPNLQVLEGRQSRTPFPEWWARPIAKGKARQQMTRMDIVCAVADMDGGAHVDGSLPNLYRSFQSGEFFGWTPALDGPAGAPQYIHSPQYACIRAISHEVLLTLQKYRPEIFARPCETTHG